VTSVIRRTGLLMTAVASVAALTACGTGSSQPNAAVIIDDRTISVDQVQAVLEKVVQEQPAAEPLAQQHKLDLVAREVVSQLIVHELITKAAREENLSVDQDQLNELLAQNPLGQELPTDGSVPPEQLATQLVYRARDAREVVTDQFLMQELGAKYVDRLAVNMAFVAVAQADPSAAAGNLRADAEDLARKFAANPDGVGDIIESATAEGLNANPNAEFIGALQPELEATVMFGSPEGSVVVFQPSAEQELWVVGMILERSENATVPAESQQEVPEVTADQLVPIGERLLQPLAEEIGITISPRYGVWDPSAMGVAPNEDEFAGLVLPPSADRR
jgi:hypothetical protein